MSRTRILVLTAILFAAAVGEKVHAATGPFAGRTVSNVGFTVSPRGTVSSLRFTLLPAAQRVRVRVSRTGAWRRCDVAGPNVICALNVRVAALQQLELDV